MFFGSFIDLVVVIWFDMYLFILVSMFKMNVAGIFRVL